MQRLLIACAFAAGCGETAILELTLELPPAGQERSFLYVQARSGDRSLEEEWSEGSSVGELPLGTTSRTEQISIVAAPEHLAEPLLLKLRFCRGSRCDHLLDPGATPSEIWVTIERAFYDGERTELTIAIPMVPMPCDSLACFIAGLRAIDKCDVRGCTDQLMGPFCSRDRHPCE